jgi:hypothetical protein
LCSARRFLEAHPTRIARPGEDQTLADHRAVHEALAEQPDRPAAVGLVLDNDVEAVGDAVALGLANLAGGLDLPWA